MFYRQQFKLVLDKLTLLITNNIESTIKHIEPLFKIVYCPKEEKNVDAFNQAIAFFPNSLPDSDILKAEFEIFSNYCKDENSVNEFAILSEKLKNVLPLVNKMYKLTLTAPVTVSSNERTFSKLKLIKNYLRSTMGNDRLDFLILLFSEKDIVDKVNIENIVKNWSTIKNRRIQTI